MDYQIVDIKGKEKGKITLDKKVFGIEEYSFSKMDYTNPEHLALKNFVMTTCRIAYEQTVKAMKSYLNEKSNPKGLEKFAV